MKPALRFFLIVIALGASLVALDRGFGAVMERLTATAKGGDTANHRYINLEAADSVLVMGSSRANHHYDSSILEERFGMPVYNCGTDGNGILLAAMQLNNILGRGVRPRVVIYDYYAKFDVFDSNDHIKPLARMRPYCELPGMADIIDDLDPSENLKLRSGMYRYNSSFLQIISDNVRPRQSVVKGYKPLTGEMDAAFGGSGPTPEGAVDSLKVRYLRRFIELCRRNDIRPVFVFSPHFLADENPHLGPLRREAGDSTLILDYSGDGRYCGRRDLFEDPSHLNAKGSALFSRELADTLAVLGAVR